MVAMPKRPRTRMASGDTPSSSRQCKMPNLQGKYDRQMSEIFTPPSYPAISPDTAAKNSIFACAVPVEPQNMLHDLANLANL